jgi:hypothetical protein
VSEPAARFVVFRYDKTPTRKFSLPREPALVVAIVGVRRQDYKRFLASDEAQLRNNGAVGAAEIHE